MVVVIVNRSMPMAQLMPGTGNHLQRAAMALFSIDEESI